MSKKKKGKDKHNFNVSFPYDLHSQSPSKDWKIIRKRYSAVKMQIFYNILFHFKSLNFTGNINFYMLFQFSCAI